MHYPGIFLALALALMAACTMLPPDPDSAWSGDKMRERYFTGCEPQTEVPPKLVSGRAPIYPPIRYSYREDGYAIVEFDVTPEGKVANVTNIESSHPAFFGHTSVAIKEWLFEPASQNGASITVHCSLRQTFSASGKR